MPPQVQPPTPCGDELERRVDITVLLGRRSEPCHVIAPGFACETLLGFVAWTFHDRNVPPTAPSPVNFDRSTGLVANVRCSMVEPVAMSAFTHPGGKDRSARSRHTLRPDHVHPP